MDGMGRGILPILIHFGGWISDANRLHGGDIVRKRGIFRGVVVENRVLCTDHYRLVLGVAGFPGSEPGQFLQVDCDGESEVEGEGCGEFEWAGRGWRE